MGTRTDKSDPKRIPSASTTSANFRHASTCLRFHRVSWQDETAEPSTAAATSGKFLISLETCRSCCEDVPLCSLPESFSHNMCPMAKGPTNDSPFLRLSLSTSNDLFTTSREIVNIYCFFFPSIIHMDTAHNLGSNWAVVSFRNLYSHI